MLGMKRFFDLPTHQTTSAKKKSKFQVWLIGASQRGGRCTVFARGSSLEE